MKKNKVNEIFKALEIIDDLDVCHGCECWQDHDWGGCYRTSTTGKMACDLRDEALDILREALTKRIAKPERKMCHSGTICRICRTEIGFFNYCPNCGTMIDWSLNEAD